MAKQRRWMKWVFEEAENFDVILPWERGAQRMKWRRHLTGEILKLQKRPA